MTATVSPVSPLEERAQRALEVTRRILELSHIPAEVELTTAGGGRIQVRIYPETDEDGVLLTGRQRTTIMALQMIVGRIVNKAPGRPVAVGLTVVRTADERSARLAELAERLAARSVEHRVEFRLMAMESSDRRAVHQALEGRRGITSRSEEFGIARCLVISPAREE